MGIEAFGVSFLGRVLPSPILSGHTGVPRRKIVLKSRGMCEGAPVESPDDILLMENACGLVFFDGQIPLNPRRSLELVFVFVTKWVSPRCSSEGGKPETPANACRPAR